MVAILALLPYSAILVFEGFYTSLALQAYLIAWLVAFAAILRSTNSWSYLIAIAALVGAFHVLLVQAMFPDIGSYWIVQLKAFAEESKVFEDAAQEKQDLIVLALSQYMTGMVGMFIVSTKLGIIMIGRWMQDRLYNPGGLRKELLAIRMPVVASAGLMICYLGMFFSPVLFKDLFFVAVLPFVCAGLSLIHAIAQTKKSGLIILIVTYIALLLLVFYVLNLLAILAVLDSWYNYRDKYRGKLK